MSQIERYYGVVDAITTPTLLVSVDTRVMAANRSFTIDILYGGRETANPTYEQTWLYRYIITCVNLEPIVQILDTHNVTERWLNTPRPISSSIDSDVFVNLYIDMSGTGGDPSSVLTTYDCSLNYV
jgi:hypothetical protein